MVNFVVDDADFVQLQSSRHGKTIVLIYLYIEVGHQY